MQPPEEIPVTGIFRLPAASDASSISPVYAGQSLAISGIRIPPKLIPQPSSSRSASVPFMWSASPWVMIQKSMRSTP